MMEPETSSTVLSKIEHWDKSNAQKQLFLQTKSIDKGNEGFEITVLDGSNVWEGKISEKYLDEQCENLRMDFNSYLKDTLTALTGSANTDSTFECTFKIVNQSNGQLLWKKIPTKSIKYCLGTVDLKKSNRPAEKMCSIFSQCISQSQSSQVEINTLETTNQRLSQDRQNALKRLEKCVAAKEQLEKDLYSKFVLVLNSKKERIAQLETQIEENSSTNSYLDGNADANTDRPVKSPVSHDTHKAAVERISDSSAAYDIDTDDETTPAKKSRAHAPTSSTSILSSSLNLEDDDDGQNTTNRAPAVRRARRQPQAKKETIAKPVLPRVSSKPSNDDNDQPGSRRSSLRKSGSVKSNKSSDNLDPDDLMDEF